MKYKSADETYPDEETQRRLADEFLEKHAPEQTDPVAEAKVDARDIVDNVASEISEGISEVMGKAFSQPSPEDIVRNIEE